MGAPGYFAFSFLRGAILDVIDQKQMRMGIVVKHPKKTVVKRPPPILYDMYPGTRMSAVKSSPLEKLSDPGPSAGRGAFLIEEYCLPRSVS